MTLSTEENVKVLIDSWKLMVGRLPGARIEESDGVTTTFAHVPLPFLNIAILDRPMPDAAAFGTALSVAKERAKACAHPSLLAVCEDWAPADWVSLAAEAGLVPALNMVGMVAEELVPPRRPAPAIDIRRVTDDRIARDLAVINAHAYGMPPELFECICNMHLWHGESFGYVGYVDGRAVSTASTFAAAGTVYVALVATMPDAHRQGYADAVMRHAIAEGRRGTGLRRTTLHATDMGRPVYEAMGFVAGGKVPLLAPAGH